VMLFMDVGLFAVLIALAVIMAWRLVDLFKKKGRWKAEIKQDSLENEGGAE